MVVPDDPDARRRRLTGIGERIRRLRLQRGMTQGQLAGDRFSKAYVSALERARAAPSMRSLEYIAEQLRVRPEFFLLEEPGGEEVAMPASIKAVRFSDGRVYADLDDGRSVGLPLRRSPRLMAASLGAIEEWRVTDAGRTVSWPALDERISLAEFLGVRVLARSEVEDAPRRTARGRPRKAYAPLREWLDAQSGPEVTISMSELESVLGRPLPPSALRYAGPWSSSANPLCAAIRAAGWRASPDLTAKRVRFIRR